MQTTKDRLTLFLDYLNIGQAKFAELCGLSKGFANNVGDAIRVASMNKILAVYPELNKSWLLTGEGEMLKSSTLTPVIIEEMADFTSAQNQGLKLIPEIDFKFSAGNLRLANDEHIARYWYLPDCTDCDAVSPIVGNSMLPTFPAGCFVALKKIGFSEDRASEIPFGNVFGVVVEDPDTGEYFGHIKVLRRYKDRELSKKYIIAHSINYEEFDDFDIRISQIRSLWIVKQHMVNHTL